MSENKICAFTGHRNLNLGGFDNGLLDRVILNLIKNGTEKFLCGMAVGFDLAAAESVLLYKKDFKVNLTACIPCANQSDTFPTHLKTRYEKILSECDEVITLAPEYFSGCMQQRNRYMVENSDIIVCYLRKKSGGTFYTVNYARKLGKKIIEI